jgi:hypothetical protein
MIGEVVQLLADLLNEHLSEGSDGKTNAYKIFLPDGTDTEGDNLKKDAVSILLLHWEPDSTLPGAEPYRRGLSGGKSAKVQPEMRLNLFVLFVSRFQKYDRSLRYLEDIIQYFRLRPVLDHDNTPALSADLEKLSVELVPLPFAESREVGKSLGTVYQPSVLYKVGFVVLRDEDPAAAPQITETALEVHQS